MRVHTMRELGAGHFTPPAKHASRLLRRRDLQQGEASANFGKNSREPENELFARKSN